jgi:3-deoxy-D-manno-octulosonic-acid transferase
LPTIFIYVLYWILQALAFPVLLLYLSVRVLKNRRYLRGLSERFGFLPPHIHTTLPGAVWLHAVSVGEALTAAVLLRRLRPLLPGVPVFVSTTTLAGRALCEEKLSGLADAVFYAPLDYRFAVRRVLRRLRPALLIVMETEIWPNLFREARRSGARLLIVNARISDRALPRYLRLRWFFRRALGFADRILAQDAAAASRYRSLGAKHVEIAGNLKYDFDPDATHIPADIAAFLDQLRPGPVWIAASTMPPALPGDPDEDDIVLDAFQQLAPRFPRLLLILAPRRPERFQSAADKLSSRDISFLRRSRLAASSSVSLPGVLLLDSIGELNSLFRAATAVFMGGTFPRRGGHNLLEPAAFGVPVLAGPHMENFAEMADEFRQNRAMISLDSPAELAQQIERLCSDSSLRLSLGERARSLAEDRRGATERAVAAIRQWHDAGLPRPAGFQLLASLWLAGMALHRAAARLRPDNPEKPVISIGNLAMGGTGKTPFVRFLCRELAAEGLRPAVLIRGYKRPNRHTVAALPGELPPVADTGEEALLILRDRTAAVAIGADRAAARRKLLSGRRFAPDLYILDDGFQHWRTRRELDIVLIDAIDPFRGGVFPHGRLREPFSALRRAGAIVITGAAPGRPCKGLIEEIRRHNPAAPVYRARLVPQAHFDGSGSRVGAFCGIGQPESFRRTLSEIGVKPAFFKIFPDHHHYREADILPLLEQAGLLLTTEKDLMNLPPSLQSEDRIEALSVRLELDDPAALLAQVLSSVSAARGSSGS